MTNTQLSLFDFSHGPPEGLEEVPAQIEDRQVSHPYIAMLKRLGTPQDAMPSAGDKEAVLKAK